MPEQRFIFNPESEDAWLALRKDDLTSTDIPALFNLSPYLTLYELWYRKHDKLDIDFKVNERAEWGNDLEPAIAKAAARKQGWKIRPMKEYIRLMPYRLGSSFDFRIMKADTDTHDDEMLEIKNVDFSVFHNNWIYVKEEDYLEAPAHIELQLQQQLLVAGLPVGNIAALVGGNKINYIRREADKDIHKAIIERSQEFWRSIDEHREPEPNFELDAEVFIRMNQYAQPGSVCDLRGNDKAAELVQISLEQAALIKEAESKRETCKAELLSLIGDAEKATGDGFSITAGIVGPAHVEYDRNGYRMFKINRKKLK